MTTIRFTLRQLEIFAAVMHSGQVRRAAETLHLSQAAVSQALRELAQALDAVLFTRVGRELRPTAAAHQLLALTHTPRAALSDIGAQLHGAEHADLAGPVRIAASSTIARYLLPRALAGLIQRHLALRLTLTSGNSAEIETRVADGDADIAFIEGPSTRGDLQIARWRTDELVIIGPASAPATLDTTELVEHAWVAREAGSGTRVVFEHALALAGLPTPSPTAIIDDSGALIRAVAAGAGLACVSESAAENAVAAGAVRQIAVVGVILERPLWLAQRRSDPASPMIRRLLSDIDALLDQPA